ncbi:MAG: hypothetical protein BGO26_15060 [Actinobacteria bacterium 69-20]|nr:extracellular solute-binding protein [Actinomycetota bacterium]OJV29609.1 MAG: hypothetical protein BGO26_15060 [Actinobacteria bacterium 69-20]
MKFHRSAWTGAALAAVAAVTLAACSSAAGPTTGGGASNSSADSGAASSTGAGASDGAAASTDKSTDTGTDASPAKGTLTLWHYYTDREADAVQKVVDQFQAANPGITVKITGGQGSQDISKAISTGSDIDVVILGGGSDLGVMCGSGAFQDLGPQIKKDGLDLSQFVDTPLKSSAYNGVQCSLPLLSDVYGLFYNKDLLSAAGFTEPPKTLDELETMALKLTTYNADGSIKTLGFNPMMGFYENQSGPWSAAVGAAWMAGDKSAISTDSAWAKLIEWQKAFVDKVGYSKLKAFTAGLGDEWSGDNAFQTGQVAMMMDGEWRVAFIEDQKPDLHYGTAPFPVAADKADLYGGGLAMSTYVGIAKTAKGTDLAFKLVKYLAADTGALVTLTNEIKNIPTTQASLASPDLKISDQFRTFLDIAKSPHVFTVPQVATGTGPQDTLLNYWEEFQSGAGGDLTAGLKKVDDDIDNALALSAGP